MIEMMMRMAMAGAFYRADVMNYVISLISATLPSLAGRLREWNMVTTSLQDS
jgi:hypothetical protein